MKKIDLTGKEDALKNLLKPFYRKGNYYSSITGQINSVKVQISTTKPKKILKQLQNKLKSLDIQLHKPYSDFSDKNAYAFLKILGVHFCPYCNINDIYTVFDKNGKKICRPDIDHFFSQSAHPQKQLDLKNLVPSCLTCNQRLKGDKEISASTHLNPYNDDFDEIMEFTLDLKGADYMAEENFDIIIQKRSGVNSAEEIKAEGNIALFKLRERYQYYKNEIIPLMRNLDFYTQAKRREIEKLFDENYCVPFRSILFPEEKCEINNTRLGKLKKDIIKKFATRF